MHGLAEESQSKSNRAGAEPSEQGQRDRASTGFEVRDRLRVVGLAEHEHD